ncbi:MAG: hypothetical protein U9N51_09230 [Bacteroidota bacterium]|nr:hypothetical protein [Bacteroidota bacterium]
MKYVFSFLILLGLSLFAFSQSNNRQVASCEPPMASADLHVNNVRARIHSGGDMWWDLWGKPKYEIPKGSGSHSIFAGAIWMGGYDSNDQLHLMAQYFRQGGNDAFTGPLIVSGEEQASTDMTICREYDKIFELFRDDVIEFRAWWVCSQNPNCNTEEYFPGYVIPQSILNWPAHGPQGGYSYYLAPFYDVNEDGLYNPYDGDFPYYEFPEDGITDNPNCLDTRDLAPKLYGDQTLWWVYNDAGNEHTETGGEPIGVEVQAQAFAYADQGVLNNQTFYQYNLINRSTNVYHDFRVGLWTDADLGGGIDDFIGCDVQRGLGYCYNGDDFDDDCYGNPGYGVNPPAVGFDFVSGLFKDVNSNDDLSNWDTIAGVRVLDCGKADFMNGNINGQNYGDGIVDNERCGMNHFIYLQTYFMGPGLSDFTAADYYRVLKSMFLDGSELYYGGTGHYSGGADTNVEANFMYPGNPSTDQCGWGQNGQVMGDWSEESEGNPADDRRFVMSMEAITLQPGETNNFTVATVWARGDNGAQSSVAKLKKVDDAVQAMFDRCFRVLDGPDYPELNIVELDSKLIFHINNSPASNNYLEQYVETDQSLACDDCDKKYRFQGYQIFQLKSADVDFYEERYNPDLVQEIFQCDIRDDVSDLVNYKYNADWSSLSDQLEVEAANEGIKHSFELTNDAFPWGETENIVNHKEMYFVAIAYASNTDFLYSPFNQTSFFGQKTPYLISRNAGEMYSATAHKPIAEQGGTLSPADYGDGLAVTQIEGLGNGNNVLELSDESIAEIMSGSPWKIKNPEYCGGNSPVNICIIDPLNVKAEDFTLGIRKTDSIITWSYGEIKEDAKWFLVNSSGDTILLKDEIGMSESEILFPEYGFSIELYQVEAAGYRNENPQQNGMLSATMQYENPEADWLHFLQDDDGLDAYNWIRVGNYQTNELENPDWSYDDYIGFDPDEYFEQMLEGTWAPYVFASNFKYGPAYDNYKSSYIRSNIHKHYPLSSVDIVLTPDKDMWSRAIVLEMCENNWTTNEETGNPEEVTPLENNRSEGNALRFDLRQHASVDKDGNEISGDTTHGLGWFPGYAIDVRTGERLNIAFGEDSWLVEENGNDMLWNPTNSKDTLDGPLFGGKHYIYVYGSNQLSPDPTLNPLQTTYDSSAYAYAMMRTYEETDLVKYKIQALSGIMWTAIPLWNTAHNFLDNEVTIKLRVATPYYRNQRNDTPEYSVNDNLPYYQFSTQGFETITNDDETAKFALDLIRVVPNPYYGYSYYQLNSTERQVKITNLPEQCVVSIFTVSGQLVRRWDKHTTQSWIDWDLTDRTGIRISGGMYIVHIDAPGIGEKVVKWFGALSE